MGARRFVSPEPGDGIRWIRRHEGVDTVVVNGEITWTAIDRYPAAARAGRLVTR
jgi:N-acyl-D-amino-acid deacylase